MPAPREIIDGLESILEIFASNIRHRERAVFILCDNLVELACKTKAVQRDHTFNRRCGFHDAWNAPGVQLARNGLGGRIHGRRDTRNQLQHGSAAITVTIAHCADAIIDLRKVIDKLWPNSTRNSLNAQYQCILLIVELYSSAGDSFTQQRFEDAMRQESWRGMAEERRPRTNEGIIELGLKMNWFHAIQRSPAQVEQLLDSL